MKPHEKWWLEKLMDGRLLPDHDGWRQEVRRDDLYDDYISATGRLGLSHRGIATELGIHLSRLLPPGYPQRFQHRLASAPGKPPKRAWFWGLPPLPDCRTHFDRISGGATTWHCARMAERPTAV